MRLRETGKTGRRGRENGEGEEDDEKTEGKFKRKTHERVMDTDRKVQ